MSHAHSLVLDKRSKCGTILRMAGQLATLHWAKLTARMGVSRTTFVMTVKSWTNDVKIQLSQIADIREFYNKVRESSALRKFPQRPKLRISANLLRSGRPAGCSCQFGNTASFERYKTFAFFPYPFKGNQFISRSALLYGRVAVPSTPTG